MPDVTEQHCLYDQAFLHKPFSYAKLLTRYHIEEFLKFIFVETDAKILKLLNANT